MVPIPIEIAQPTGSRPQVTTLIALPRKVKKIIYKKIIMIQIAMK